MNRTATKTVKARTITTGRNYGTIGQLVARNGRVIWESDTKPYGFTAAALDAAVAAADKRGWIVSNRD